MRKRRRSTLSSLRDGSKRRSQPKEDRGSNSQRRPAHSSISIKSFADDFEPEQSRKCYCHNCKMRYVNREQKERMNDELEFKLVEVLNCIESQVEQSIADLDHLVRYKSISVELKYRKIGCDALEWVANRLASLKFRTNLIPISNVPDSCFQEPLQNVLFANYFSSPTKTTVLIYAHVDVVPAERECWFNEPFELSIREGQLYGRGVSSGKGMLVGWLHAFECWLKVNNDLPINVKIIVDMLHEVGSEGVQKYVETRSDFFLDVDYMIFDANSWLNKERPVIACGLTGWAHFGIQVRGANKSLEAGLAGGLVFEPMTDVCHLMNSMLSNTHEIKIPRIDHMVRRLSVTEWQLLETAEFSTSKYMDRLEIRRLRHEDNKVNLLQNRWCKPTLCLHGIEGSDNESECSRTLPMLVTGKFSIKLVPDQELPSIHAAVQDYLHRMCTELHVSTHMKLLLLDSCEPTSWSTTSKHMNALSRAVTEIYLKEPVATAGIAVCLPIASVYRRLINKPILLVPYAMRRDRHHQENESIHEDHFVRHTKVCASLLFEISTLNVKCKCGYIPEYCHLKGVAERLAAERGEDVVVESSFRKMISKLRRRKVVHQPPPERKTKKTIADYLCGPLGKKLLKKRASKPKKQSKQKEAGPERASQQIKIETENIS
ncbi:cytosolic non-specific dipeptidase-like [Drosophila sulfurigaster albostrigata]|uniref:cytosolic non-specific dipeptidase-like n=1 Tax=Drosophila sulfurigaster albostrigata TaxID=89887 RepID=UPI002D21CE6D|nr:cytosolic non-specific dipeptidase-like [Drosophila sulfurigaster albostrigata]XP_062130141.1 cytosolic non-specific dipeptidase-like [Drosophila sulfurigaster albostrigata]